MTEDLIERLQLARSPGIGPVTYRQLMARFGSASAALAAIPDLARGAAGVFPNYSAAEMRSGRLPGSMCSARDTLCLGRGSIRVCSPSSTMLRRC